MNIFNSFMKKIKSDSNDIVKDDTKLNMDEWWKQINKKVHEDAVKQEELTGKDYVSPNRQKEPKRFNPYDEKVQEELDKSKNDIKLMRKFLEETDYVDLNLLLDLDMGRPDFYIGSQSESDLFKSVQNDYIKSLYEQIYKFQNGEIPNIEFENNIKLINNEFRNIFNTYLKDSPKSYDKIKDYKSNIKDDFDFDFKKPDDNLNIEEIEKQKNDYVKYVLNEATDLNIINDLLDNEELREQHFKQWFKSYFDSVNSSYTKIIGLLDNIQLGTYFKEWRDAIKKYILNPVKTSLDNNESIDTSEYEAILKSINNNTFYKILKESFNKFVGKYSKYNTKNTFKDRSQQIVNLNLKNINELDEGVDLNSLNFKVNMLATDLNDNKDKLSSELNDAINNYPTDDNGKPVSEIELSDPIKSALNVTCDFFKEPITQFNMLCNILKLHLNLKIPMKIDNKDAELDILVKQKDNLSEDKIKESKKLSENVNSILLNTEILKNTISTFKKYSDNKKNVYVSKSDLEDILHAYKEAVDCAQRNFKYIESLYIILNNDVSNKLRYNV